MLQLRECRDPAVLDAFERSGETNRVALDEGAAEVGLAREVIVQAGLRHAEFSGYVGIAEPVEAARLRQALGDVQDLAGRLGHDSGLRAHDAGAVAALLTDDTVFENTGPVPDGWRIEGKAAVAAFWEKWFAANADARFEAEEIIVAGDRCVVRWIYRKTRDGKPWHLRGVDVLTVRDGKIAAKLAYVKG